MGTAHAAGLWMRHLGFGERDVLLMQTAALVHDIGHVCYSHLFDKVAPTIHWYDDTLQSHENRSTFVFRRIVMEHKLDYAQDEVDLVCDLIHGKQTRLPNLISNDIDVDRLDYLRRDSYYTGVPIGFQTDRIIDNSSVDDQKQIIYKAKAQSNIDQFLHTRTLFYSEIYRHHTVEKINKMILKAIALIKDQLATYFQKDHRWMTELDDFTVHYLLMKNPQSAQILRKIETRQLNEPLMLPIAT